MVLEGDGVVFLTPFSGNWFPYTRHFPSLGFFRGRTPVCFGGVVCAETLTYSPPPPHSSLFPFSSTGYPSFFFCKKASIHRPRRPGLPDQPLDPFPRLFVFLAARLDHLVFHRCCRGLFVFLPPFPPFYRAVLGVSLKLHPWGKGKGAPGCRIPELN